MKAPLIAVVVVALSTPLAAQWLNHPTQGIPRNPDGRGKVPLIASSETAFAGLYGLGVEFVQGGTGGLFVKHVSGNYRFTRR